MSTIDWIIVAAYAAAVIGLCEMTRRHARTVAGFLAADRCAGRYLITVAYNMAQVGVITLVWYFQLGYDVGFTQMWWGYIEGPSMIVLAITGWVIYRFRQTRALTLAQFFEQRYSKRFRVFSGFVAFASGILNYGIFPGVTARFFAAACGLGKTIPIGTFDVPTVPLLMFILLSLALYLVFAGGQLAIMVSDFLQGVFAYGVFVFLCFWFLLQMGWPVMERAMLAMPEGTSMLDPLGLGGEKNFNVLYWGISAFILFYSARAWQGDQGYNAAARDAHEARMAQLLNGWRWRVLMLFTIIVPLAVRAFLTQPEYADAAAPVHEALNAAAGSNEALRAELRTPLALGIMLPAGVLGLVIAAMLGAAVTTDNAYLHSWGTILVQDVILPLRGKPLTPRAHLLLLKIAIFCVAVFAFCFSLWFDLGQYISMFGALTASIFVAGAGAAIIGGLYTRRGTLAAAWSAMLFGIVVSVWGVVVNNLPSGALDYLQSGAAPWLADHVNWTRDHLTGQIISFGAMAGSLVVYVLVSLLGPRREFDLDRLLHREARAEQDGPRTMMEKLGFDREYQGADRPIAYVTVAWPLFWTVVFIVVTPWLLWRSQTGDPVSAQSWSSYWHAWTWFILSVSVIVWTWWTIGGFRDLRRMFQHLRQVRADSADDGRVAGEP